MPRLPRPLRPFLPLVLFAALGAVPASALVPPNFVVDDAVPGDSFVWPTAFAFLNDDRFLVAEHGERAAATGDGRRDGGVPLLPLLRLAPFLPAGRVALFGGRKRGGPLLVGCGLLGERDQPLP